jgi:uncharacterized protein (TIGR02117 family)
MRVVRRVVQGMAAVAVIAVLGTIVPRPLAAPDDAGARTRRILVVTNPIHSDIILPLDADIRAAFADLGDAGLPVRHENARWLAVGWGSRAFYVETPTWGDLKPVPLFKALTVDSAVMHVTVFGEIDPGNPNVTEYTLSDERFGRLVAFVRESFVRDAVGQPVALIGAAYGPDDAFFEAHGVFNALVGCNTWTAKGLRVAGLQTGWWNPLPQSLSWSLAIHN